MSTTPEPRELRPSLCTRTGDVVFKHTLTPSSRTDRVHMKLRRIHALPIIFVPGIMGSNLRGNASAEKSHINRPVWRMDSELKLLHSLWDKSPDMRQRLLHPERTEVDDQGEVPTKLVGSIHHARDYTDRGWGQVGKISYHAFLMWLEENLNPQRPERESTDTLHTRLSLPYNTRWNPQKPGFAPLTTEESIQAQQWDYPVFACGYNWLESNTVAAERLAQAIQKTIDVCNQSIGHCAQVILVTHSMGGLVARACSKLPGMEAKIAGVVHGVMPAVGAAVAYRRCKVGMWDEDAAASLVIGRNGRAVTAVFAQAPGALQLLPSGQYPADKWLEIRDTDGNLLPELPSTQDPYQSIYLERNKWWGLVNEEWLSPNKKTGKPITWDDYEDALKDARDFHNNVIKDHYHPNTWAFYGTRVDSFERVVWRMEPIDQGLSPGVPKPTAAQVLNTPYPRMQMTGSNPEAMPAAQVQLLPNAQLPRATVMHYHLRLETSSALYSRGSGGDGTVPEISGKMPMHYAQVRQVFALPHVQHEGAYRDSMEARHLTAYAISKIAAQCKLPSSSPSAA